MHIVQIGKHLVRPYRRGLMRIVGVGKPMLLHNVRDGVETETVHAFFQPPLDHIVEFRDNLGMFPV
ncbi:hypothetical protein D1872_297730 [compost metagenome]